MNDRTGVEVTFQIRNKKVLGSNLGRDIDYSEGLFFLPASSSKHMPKYFFF
jgi:hypothetical protein